jgi:cytochrome b6-f complex iron-sulfur subunit
MGFGKRMSGLRGQGVGFLSYFRAQRATAFGGVVRAGALGDFPAGTVTRITRGKHYIVHTEHGLAALFWRCRHLGCTVPWNERETYAKVGQPAVTGVFQCPCHGSVHTRDGGFHDGPAPGPLDLMQLRIAADGSALVETAAIRRRARVRPEHFVPARAGASGPEASDLLPHGTGI